VILSDREITDAMYYREIVISHSPEGNHVQPCSIDLHLGTRFGKLRPTQIDRYGPEPKGPEVDWATLTDSEDFITLYPGGFLLAGTWETVEILAPKLVGILCGKSTLARDGLQVEAAGLVDPGWRGVLTLELKNMGPAALVLRPRQPICQIYFSRLGEPANQYYGESGLGSHYQNAPTTQSGYDPVAPEATPRSRSGPESPRP
jgi:dCTP deaminase